MASQSQTNTNLDPDADLDQPGPGPTRFQIPYQIGNYQKQLDAMKAMENYSKLIGKHWEKLETIGNQLENIENYREPILKFEKPSESFRKCIDPSFIKFKMR